MALMLTRAKRTLGAFLFSILLYIFPSLSGGCNIADLKDGGAENADVQGSEDAAADAGSQDFGNQCGAYGPPPCSSDTDCASYGDGWYCDQANMQSWCGGEPQLYPVCKQAGDAGYEDFGNQCAAYGPKPCDSDQECVASNGEGWYCDQNHQAGYCNGQPVTWPTCVQIGDQDGGAWDYGPMDAAYGPPPCSTDQDCQSWMGSGWYCDQGGHYCVMGQDAGPADFGNPCGAYGPPPCQTDQECVTDYGTGWYCDKNHQVDMCGTPTTYPTCVPAGDT